MDLQPRLRGALLELRPLLPGDFDALYDVASDPLIWAQHPRADRYLRVVFEKFFEDALASRGAFAVLEKTSGRMIGSSRYYDSAPERREVAIGFTFLARDHWGGRTNRELKALMLDHAFQSVDTVLFHVGERNFRSQNALLKIGAARVGPIERPGLDISLLFRLPKADYEAGFKAK